MNTTKLLVLATLSTMVCSASASMVSADSFTSADFLKHPEKSQIGYIGTSVMMAGVVAAQNLPSQARCIDAWGAKHRGDGYQPILKAMRLYPDDHPTGLILAVLQKACGSFKYVK